MDDKPALYMFVGVPGAGKSTHINSLKEKLGDHYMVISTDAYIEAQAATHGKTYNEVFKDYIKEADILANANLQFAIKHNMHIIWDQTNCDKKTRSWKLNKIPKHYAKHAIAFKASREEIMRVNQVRAKFGRSIPDNIIQSMLDRFEVPTEDEGFDTVTINER